MGKLVDVYEFYEGAKKIKDKYEAETAFLRKPDSLADRILENLTQLVEINKEQVTGICSGFHELDLLTRGFKDGSYIILGARPSMGKSTLALQMILFNALIHKKGCVFVSLEMSELMLQQRIIQFILKFIFRLENAEINKDNIKKAVDHLKKFPNLIILYEKSRNLNNLISNVSRLKRTHKVEFVAIDYIGLISIDKEFESKELEVAFISAELKRFTKSIKLPVMVLSQLNRASSKRGDPIPILTDLRASGSIEQDADLVILLYRPYYYNKEEPEDLAKVMVKKNRMGRTGDAELNFIDSFFQNTAEAKKKMHQEKQSEPVQKQAKQAEISKINEIETDRPNNEEMKKLKAEEISRRLNSPKNPYRMLRRDQQVQYVTEDVETEIEEGTLDLSLPF